MTTEPSVVVGDVTNVVVVVFGMRRKGPVGCWTTRRNPGRSRMSEDPVNRMNRVGRNWRRNRSLLSLSVSYHVQKKRDQPSYGRDLSSCRSKLNVRPTPDIIIVVDVFLPGVSGSESE